jgi:chorismate mutase/prephenate dehydratase
MTRFLVLGENEAKPSGKDRTSLAMTAHNRPGAVHELITPFARHGVSMSRIESRPARTGQAPFVKIFGSYPVGEF